MITVTAVRPPARSGEITIINNRVKTFKENPKCSLAGLMEVSLSQIIIFLNLLKMIVLF